MVSNTEEPVPSDKFCLTCASKFAGNAELNSRVHVPSRLPFFRPLAFVLQASQSVPRFVSLVFRRLKIRLRYEPSFIRRVIRQLVYNIFRCNDDLTSTDLSLSLSLSCFSLIIHHSTTDSLFLETPISVALKLETNRENYLSTRWYKYMFSIDLWFCLWREIFYSLFLSLSRRKKVIEREWRRSSDDLPQSMSKNTVYFVNIQWYSLIDVSEDMQRILNKFYLKTQSRSRYIYPLTYWQTPNFYLASETDIIHVIFQRKKKRRKKKKKEKKKKRNVFKKGSKIE